MVRGVPEVAADVIVSMLLASAFTKLYFAIPAVPMPVEPALIVPEQSTISRALSWLREVAMKHMGHFVPAPVHDVESISKVLLVAWSASCMQPVWAVAEPVTATL